MPIAVAVEPGIAVGCAWWGMVGGGFPDWFDLRSDLRRPLRLRHRGASHSVFAGILATVSIFWLLATLNATDFTVGEFALTPSLDAVWLWSATFALGFASHLIGDSCTRAGIRPLLPFSAAHFWVLPRGLRTRSDGFADRIGWLVANLVIVVGLALYAVRLLRVPG